MKLQIIFATGNQNKIREIREIITDPKITLMSMKEAGAYADCEENGETFKENALIKARAVASLLEKTPSPMIDPSIPYCVMSDDSGLVIDALGGEPGIHSARFMGHDTSYTIKMNAILDQMKNVPAEKRTARFVASVAAVFPDGREEAAEGIMEGMIANKIKGEHGFGYDPFFYLPEYGKTSAELTDDEKNAISHRGKAIRAMMELLRN